MIIFIESGAVDFVQKARTNREKHTKIVRITLEDIPYYRDLDIVKNIMNSAEFQDENQNYQEGKVR